MISKKTVNAILKASAEVAGLGCQTPNVVVDVNLPDDMEQIDIEFKESGTSSYSPWHLEIADELGVSLITMDDMCWFVRIGEDIFRIRDYQEAYKLSEFFRALAYLNDKNMLSEEGVMQEVDKVKNNENSKFHLEKCIPLAQFKEKLLKEHGK